MLVVRWSMSILTSIVITINMYLRFLDRDLINEFVFINCKNVRFVVIWTCDVEAVSVFANVRGRLFCISSSEVGIFSNVCR